MTDLLMPTRSRFRSLHRRGPWALGQPIPPVGTPINYAHPLARGLVGLWRLENNGRDDSGNVNTGAFHLGGAYAAGMFGRCAGFVGDGGHMDFPNTVLTPGAFTVLCRWKRSGDSGGSGDSTYHCLLASINGSIVNNLCVLRDGTEAATYVRLGGISKTAALAIPDASTWHLVGGAWNGVDKLWAIVDGTWGTPTAVSGVLFDGVTPLLLGRYQNNFYYANGLVDEAGIWNRLLSPFECWDFYRRPHQMFVGYEGC